MAHFVGGGVRAGHRLWWELVKNVVRRHLTAANTGKVGGKLVIDNVYGGTWTCQFNPFNPSVLGPGITFAPVYEPLEFVNILQSKNPPVPMLATGSQWSNGFKTLTFTIHNGVTWSDGKPFGAADVAYTFNAMKADKTIDLNALWAADGGPLTSVAVTGTNQVVFKFNAPSQPIFYFVADQTPIVPQHIWSTLNQSSFTRMPTLSPSAPGLTWSRAARRRTSSTCATQATGRASPAIRCRRSRRSTIRRSSATRRATCSSPRARRSGAVSTSPTSSRSTLPRIPPTATSGSHRS